MDENIPTPASAGTAQASDERLIVLVGGDTVYVFDPDQKEVADMQAMVMIGANLDVDRYRATPEQLTAALDEVRADGSEVDVVDGRRGVEEGS